MSGILYICPTPIGNLEDITLRALKILKEVDLVACEDTRNTIKLLNHYNIKNKLTSYHENNKNKKTITLIEKLKDGLNLALVSDAGMPGISDPGYDLIKEAIEENIEVCVLPGASALVCSAVYSGLPTRRIAFEGFLPKNNNKKREILEELKNETRTIILYESPHHILKTLTLLKEYIGENRKIAIVKELTKKYEQRFNTTLQEAIDFYENNEPRGEYIIVIKGLDINEKKEKEYNKWDNIDIFDHMKLYESEGKKEAMKKVALDRGITKREVYSILNKEENNND